MSRINWLIGLASLTSLAGSQVAHAGNPWDVFVDLGTEAGYHTGLKERPRPNIDVHPDDESQIYVKPQIVLYEHKDFTGDWARLEESDRNLNRNHDNVEDKVSSVIVYSGTWSLWTDPDFTRGPFDPAPSGVNWNKGGRYEDMDDLQICNDCITSVRLEALRSSLMRVGDIVSLYKLSDQEAWVKAGPSSTEMGRISSKEDAQYAMFKVRRGFFDTYTVAFESITRPGWFLMVEDSDHARERAVELVKLDLEDEQAKRQATFTVLGGLHDSRGLSFKPLVGPGHLANQDGQLVVGINTNYNNRTFGTYSRRAEDAITGPQTQPLALGSGVSIYGSEFARPSYSKAGGFVQVGGHIKRIEGDWTRDRVIGTLPRELAPDKRLMFNLNQHDEVARMDVLPDGSIRWIAGREDLDWVSLDGIGYSLGQPEATNPFGALAYADGMRDYSGGGGYAPGRYTQNGLVVSIEGQIERTSGQWQRSDRTPIATLPEWACPSETRVFNVNRHEQTARVDVQPDCQVVFRSGDSNGLAWLSLAGIAYSLDTPTALELGPEIVSYGSGYADPGYTVSEGTVRLQGLAKRYTTEWSRFQVIGTVPPELAPARTRIFNVSQHNSTARVDVQPDGKVVWRGGESDLNWISLEGIAYSLSDEP